MSTSASAIGLGGSSSYTLKDLWSKASRTTTGSISASVPSHGTVLYRVARGGPAPNRLEAESATVSQGAVESNHLGFSGTGFVNYDNLVGSYVEWTVNATTAGPKTLVLRFANGTAVTRPMDITVNGAAAATGVGFEPTGNWDTWADKTVTVNLAAGANTVRATATSANGGPNADYIDLP